MKICFIADTVYKHGGVERVLTTIVNEISKYHQVDIICTRVKQGQTENVYNLDLTKVNIIEKNINESFIDKNIKKLFTWFKIKKSSKVYNYLLERSNIPKRAQKEFIQLINNNKYDAVIGVHGYYSLFLATIAKKINAKAIGWQHSTYEGYFQDENKHYGKMKVLFQKYFNELDVNILLSDEDKNKYEQNICKNNNYVIYNPLSFACETKSNLDNKRIIAVGRLAKSKGFDMLINSFSKFLKENAEWELIILGDGKERENITQLIKQLKLDKNIKILGFTNDVVRHYTNSSIFVSASRWEGFGLSIIEAMECGLSVIAFDNSGPKEIIDNYINGILVPCNNIEMLADELSNLANNYDKRKELGANAILRAKDFSVHSISKKWIDILS